MDIWPLFQDDWRRSLYGSVAMGNVLYLNLFEAAMQTLPKQNMGVYLQENQGWEFAFIHAWKAAGHGWLAGVPHSSVRYWDLRYFFDTRSYDRNGVNDLPLPDIVAVNGPAALSAYTHGGYPETDLVEVEALRYLHLAKAGANSHAPQRNAIEGLRILVLGDYLPQSTTYQMHLLEQAAKSLPPNTLFIVKPHPNCPIQPSDYPGIEMKLTMESIEKLLPLCDVAYTSSTTSAALDAYCSNVPVVSAVDRSTLNLSPLRGQDGALFASTPAELVTALCEASLNRKCTDCNRNFFTIDMNLNKWRKLLAKGCTL
jgi:surface carbohydrate biosynthesis protein (TIGR04326 family)